MSEVNFLDEDHRPGFQRIVRYVEGEPYYFARDPVKNSPFTKMPEAFSTLVDVGQPGHIPHSCITLDIADELSIESFESAVDAWLADGDLSRIVWKES